MPFNLLFILFKLSSHLIFKTLLFSALFFIPSSDLVPSDLPIESALRLDSGGGSRRRPEGAVDIREPREGGRRPQPGVAVLGYGAGFNLTFIGCNIRLLGD